MPTGSEQSPVEQAKDFLAHDDHCAGLDLLGPWLADNPDDASAWATLAAIHFELEDWEAAKEAATEVVRVRPNSARDWCNLGIVLRKLGEIRKADRVQHRALSLDPRYERARDELGKIEEVRSARGVHEAAAKDASSATAEADDAESSCPNCGAAVFPSEDLCVECGYNLALGATLEEAPAERKQAFQRWAVEKALKRTQYRKAEDHLVQLWQLVPEDWATGLRLASVQEAQGAFERALKTWEQLLTVHGSSEARAGYADCALRIAQMQESRHAFGEAIDTCRRAIHVVGELESLRKQIDHIRDAETTYEAEEREFARARSQRTQTATVAGGFAAVTGVLTMIAGVLLIMLGIAMVPCCIGIFILPMAFSVFAAGVGMLAGAPAGGAAIYTLGELPRAMKRFGEYWHGLTPQARQKVTIGVVIAIGTLLLLALIGNLLGAIPAST
jgi:tetratricopeptide (TPR) repeat protein